MTVRLLALVLVLASASPLAAREAPTKVVFLTNYVFLGRHAPFFVGLDEGFYREAGFELEVAPSTGSGFVISALEGGQADYGLAETAPVVQAIGKGAAVKAFAVYMDQSTSGLASLAPFGADEPLVGRKVAASLTDSARVIAPILERLAGRDPSGIEWITADPSVYFPLLVQGRAQLVTASSDSDVPTWRRVLSRQGKTVHFTSFAERGYDVFGYLLVARGDRIASRPEEARAFAEATAMAVRFALEHPEAAAASLVRHSPTLDPELALAQWRASMPAFETAFTEAHGYGRATRERLERSIELVSRAFETETELAPEDLYFEALPR
jgi:NitT/TauT family transport system substrate-binding protein